LTLEQLNIERDVDIKVEEDWRYQEVDIGVFDEHHSERSHGRHIL
jgi:protein associated with RNAse G/E